MFEIGKIAGTHGIKGTFKVFPTTENPNRFELLKEVIVNHKGKEEVFTISKVGYHKNMVLLTVKEINDINVAEG
ncbi:MAG: ribosome maturation factor RimM, partial [Anaerotignaceae bacterium]